MLKLNNLGEKRGVGYSVYVLNPLQTSIQKLTHPCILGEIGDISNFDTTKQFVATNSKPILEEG